MNNSQGPMDAEFWSDSAPWSRFKSDLVLEVHHILTEPTCPTAKVSFELPGRAGFGRLALHSGNSVDEAINNALVAAKERLDKIASLSEACSYLDVLEALKSGFWLSLSTDGICRLGLGRKTVGSGVVVPLSEDDILKVGRSKGIAHQNSCNDILYFFE